MNLCLSLVLAAGEFVCTDCGATTKQSKLNWLRHVKQQHPGTFEALLEVQRVRHGGTAVLAQAMANISDDDEDEISGRCSRG
jgi:hypothetical protein